MPRCVFDRIGFWLLVSVCLIGAACASDAVFAGEPASPQRDDDSAVAADDGGSWDVSSLRGPTFDVEIDADEGTWISLDVSPEGDEIVFDFLGDIYIMPITGGEARVLTHGVAWNMQPRFSPCGRWIAFTSDRDGGDNIWVMNRDGSEPRQVSSERFRLLNNPAWSPDGEFIVARKHFTSKRSLGAGEMWLYHRTGGGGLQMTQRPNEQKDVNDPAFSPDGRYLYYCRDVTPGRTFQYNKDSNEEIYAIERLDRETGRIDRFVSGPGGAVRPTPSPDGTTLAFVRRVRFQSTLFLMDIESGAIRPVYDQLDRDNQEAWSIHGVYPSMAWTPDSRSIVFWAGGKIRRLDVGSGEAHEIPFRVRTTRTVQEPLRHRVDVAPEEFDVRALRWVEVSPAGDRVVYQALGHVYVRDLPDGTPRRLTRQRDHFEFYPSFSRDGRWIVYTTWDDEELGSIRVAPARGGEGRIVTTEPGHYIEPVVSPDGERIVFRRVGGGWLTDPAWSRDPGVYRVPFEGGESTLITRSGAQPHFGAASDRVYLLTVESGEVEDTRRLISVNLDGGEERTHLTSGAATEFRVSPDGRWVAFTERFNAHIAPFLPTGQEVRVGPGMKSVPSRQVSRDAGEFLHWSGDSARLHWSLGPELFTRELRDAFAFIDGAPEELPEPDAEGVNISFAAPTDRPEGAVALVGARIITMRGDEVIEDGAVVVEADRIASVGRRSDVRIPRGAHVVDVQGHTITPGFIDAHAHGAQGVNGIIPQHNWVDYANLAFGVTTIHDPSNDTNTIFAASELARAGGITAPRTFSTGRILYGAAGWFKAEVDSLEDARSHLRRLKNVGAFSVKSYNQPRRDQRQQVVHAGRELEMMVVPEGGSTFQHNLTMIVDGHTGIEHNLPVETMYDDVLQLWSATEVGYTPTLVVCFGGISGEHYWYQHTDVWANERLMRFTPRHVVDPRARRRTKAPEEEYNHIRIAQGCKALVDAGGSVHIGAHGQMAGLAAHWELWMFEQGGMTPMEALRAATIDGARHLGLDDDIGSIEPGKLADLIVLERNPLENLRDSERIRFTMLNGRLFDARTMNQLGNHPDTRGEEAFGRGPERMRGGRWLDVGSGAQAPGEATCAGCAAH